MRRKKKEELETYYSSFNSAILPPSDYFTPPSPYIVDPSYADVTTLEDEKRCYVATTYPYTNEFVDGIRTVYRPAKHWEPHSTTLGDYEDFMKKREEEAEMNIISDKPFKDHYVVRCTDIIDLSVGRILKTLSAMKGKLMLDTAPFQIQNIECLMTPIVRKHIIMASKKLKMYGKNPPIIARFDEFGNRLPDEIELDFKKRSIIKHCKS